MLISSIFSYSPPLPALMAFLAAAKHLCLYAKACYGHWCAISLAFLAGENFAGWLLSQFSAFLFSGLIFQILILFIIYYNVLEKEILDMFVYLPELASLYKNMRDTFISTYSRDFTYLPFTTYHYQTFPLPRVLIITWCRETYYIYLLHYACIHTVGQTLISSFIEASLSSLIEAAFTMPVLSCLSFLSDITCHGQRTMPTYRRNAIWRIMAAAFLITIAITGAFILIVGISAANWSILFIRPASPRQFRSFYFARRKDWLLLFLSFATLQSLYT